MRRPRRRHGGTPLVLVNPFADRDLDHHPSVDNPPTGDPWDRFVIARERFRADDVDGATAIWRGITEDDDLESRHLLQAWRFLWAAGVRPTAQVARQCLGAAVQVGQGDGHDTIVAYRDGTVRIEGHTRAALFVEVPAPEEIAAAAAAMLDAAQQLADLLDTWDQTSLPPLGTDDSRFLVLTPGGQRFGQGPLDDLLRHPAANALFAAATVLFREVVARTLRK